MPRLVIVEEYGYRHWEADLTDDEYQRLLARWGTMVGLNPMVPVTLIVPQAVEFDYTQVGPRRGTLRCHVHDHDDSFLEGLDYAIPPGPDPSRDDFWMGGVHYTHEQIHALCAAVR